MTNSKLSSLKSGEEVVIPVREIIESNENGIIELKQSARSNIFIYNEQTGEKIIAWTKDGNSINIGILLSPILSANIEAFVPQKKCDIINLYSIFFGGQTREGYIPSFLYEDQER